jgi:hypothetical protein
MDDIGYLLLIIPLILVHALSFGRIGLVLELRILFRHFVGDLCPALLRVP